MLIRETGALDLQQRIIAGERQTEFPFLEVVDTEILRETLFTMLPPHLGLDGMISPRVIEAAFFAEERLAGRTRKKGRRDGVAIPDVNHSYRVAIRLAEAGITDDNTIAAALLHDTIEDSDTTEEELAERFNPEIARTVFLLSKNQHNHPGKVPSLEYYGRMRDENEDERVRLMAIQIKYADRIDNLASFLIMDLHTFMNPNRTVLEALLGNLQETFEYFEELNPENERLRNDLDRMYHRGLRRIDRDGIIAGSI